MLAPLNTSLPENQTGQVPLIKAEPGAHQPELASFLTESCLIRHLGIIELTAVEIKTEVEDKYPIPTYAYMCTSSVLLTPFWLEHCKTHVTYHVISSLHTLVHIYKKQTLSYITVHCYHINKINNNFSVSSNSHP